MKLKWNGPTRSGPGVVPAPEGWPARDHDEPDAELAKEKVASGLYKPAPGPKALKEDGGDGD